MNIPVLDASTASRAVNVLDTILASLAATSIDDEYPPDTSVPSPTVIPSSSNSLTGHNPEDNAVLLTGQCEMQLFLSRMRSRSGAERWIPCANTVLYVNNPNPS